MRDFSPEVQSAAEAGRRPPLPLVSVVLITFNGVAYIDEQIQSILGQTYPNIELIVSDDSSTDGTWERLAGYQADDRVRIIRNSGKKGVHGNLENALAHVTGSYIAVSDQDDVWHPRKLERLVHLADPGGAVFSDSQLIDEAGSPLNSTLLQSLTPRSADIGNRFARLLLTNCISGHAILFDTRLLASIVPLGEEPMYDQQMGLVAALAGGVRFIDEPLVLHRQHSGNTTNRLTQARPDKRDRPGKREKNRHRREVLSGNIDYVLGRWEELAMAYHGGRPGWRYRFQIWMLRRIKHHLERPVHGGFDAGLFCLLWPLRKDIFHRSKSKVKTIKLLKFCRF